MTIRYSGDVEIRLQYGGAGYNPDGSVYFDADGEGFYYATVRAPYVRNAAILSFREVGLPALSRKQAVSSEAYDTAALAFLKWSEKHVGDLPVELDGMRKIVVRRTFQSPCPV